MSISFVRISCFVSAFAYGYNNGSCSMKWVLPLLCIHFVLVSIYDWTNHNLILARIVLTSIYSCNNQLMFCELLLVSISWWFLSFQLQVL
jgi:hypothetical protein